MIYFLNPFNLIFLCLFNLISLYLFNLIRKNSFNSIRQNIHLILETGSSRGIRKIRAWERIIANTIWRTRKVLTLEDPFLASVLDKVEYIWQNNEGEAHAEVIDQRFNHLPGDDRTEAHIRSWANYWTFLEVT